MAYHAPSSSLCFGECFDRDGTCNSPAAIARGRMNASHPRNSSVSETKDSPPSPRPRHDAGSSGDKPARQHRTTLLADIPWYRRCSFRVSTHPVELPQHERRVHRAETPTKRAHIPNVPSSPPSLTDLPTCRASWGNLAPPKTLPPPSESLGLAGVLRAPCPGPHVVPRGPFQDGGVGKKRGGLPPRTQ